ncbi:BspA family leucine-rich repeat surface protein [Ekhidna sp.]|uniref:BspA family leucine-rich repeat surface protein n=1 Tax=Ekhidna sp. TaxID=2608089 RepID=UPI003B5004CA
MRSPRLILLLLLFCQVFLVHSQFTVNDNGDAGDFNPGDGTCETGNGNGICTLRAAIEESNASIGVDLIEFSGDLIITIDALLLITDDATTIDAGSNNITIQPGNTISGIEINGGSCVIRGLHMRGFSGAPNAAILVDGSGAIANEIYGCKLGVSLTGNVTDAANYSGISINNGATGTIIGDGTLSGANVIGGNSFGIRINNSSDNTIISGNRIGIGLDGSSIVANSIGIDVLNSDGTSIGISGDLVNVISNNSSEGIRLSGATNTDVLNNYVGVDITGLLDRGNGIGIEVASASNGVTIGGNVAARNLISGNTGYAIDVNNSNSVTITGNYIGVGSNGSTAIANGTNGNPNIRVQGTSNNTRVGDLTGTNPPNVISAAGGASSAGILVSAANTTIVDNLIGTDATGSLDRGNGGAGISLTGGSGTIGGSGLGNVISGNSYGIGISVGGFTITENYIGTNAAGTLSIPNDNEGIRLSVGTGSSITNNLISGNTLDGILIEGASTTGNNVNNNLIGTQADGTSSLGNGASGILIESDANGTSLMGNTIAFNSSNGVEIGESGFSGIINNNLSQNSIHSNTGAGILITNGAQNGVSAPTITSTADGLITGGGTAGATIQIFADVADEGEQYLASTTVSGASSYSHQVDVNTIGSGLFNISVIQTASNNTSEFATSPLTFSTPSTQASNISFSNVDFFDMDISWTNGDGSARLVVVKEGSIVDANPVNTTTYTASTVFGAGSQIGSGNYVIYNGTGSSVSLTGLNHSTTYHVMVYEYNGIQGLEEYLTTSATGNPSSQQTLGAFITTWLADATGQITIPIATGTYDYDVYWENTLNALDNGSLSNQTGGALLTGLTDGQTYRMEITGTFPRFWARANGAAEREKILTVEQWGDISWSSMHEAFYNCPNLTVPAIDAPDLSGVTSLQSMFYNCDALNDPMNHWDVGTITSFFGMFQNTDIFNQNLNSWTINTTPGVTMESMFNTASAFNGNISSWNVIGVTNMARLFSNADSFTGDLSTWDTDNVTNMTLMFSLNDAFNGNITNWNVSNVVNLSGMFRLATSFNQDLNWNVSSATTFSSMFEGASAFQGDLSSWTGTFSSNPITMSQMFKDATLFNSNISSWDFTTVTNMQSMFENADAFNQNINGWDVSTVTNLSGMFSWTELFNQPLDMWDLNSSANLSAMFYQSQAFNQDISSWTLTGITNLFNMFAFANAFNQPIGSWDVSTVTSMGNMFQDAAAFDQDLGAWNIGMVSSMGSIFSNSGMSTANYDATLIGWADDNGGTETIPIGLSLSATGVTFCDDTGRQDLIDNYSWTITDAGSNCPFVTTWLADATGQITIPTTTGTYNYDVYWENTLNAVDNGSLINQTGDGVITGLTDGQTYRIEITGTFPRIYFNAGPERLKIQSVEQWGDIVWTSMAQAFLSCNNLTVPATDAPNLSGVIDMTSMFQSCPGLTNENFNNWDVSNVQNMTQVFAFSPAFNGSIDMWDVSNVTTMFGMFWGASSFDQHLNTWTPTAVTDISRMFQSAFVFNGNIDGWNMPNLTTAFETFYQAYALNQSLNGWQFGMLDNMSGMFREAITFNGDISSWDVSTVTDMSNLFLSASVFNQDITGWETSNVLTLAGTFAGAAAFNQNITYSVIGGNQGGASWDVSGVTNMTSTFSGASQFNGNITNWDVSNVNSMPSMFQFATSFNQPIGLWANNTSMVQDMGGMFLVASAFNQDLDSWDVSSVTNMGGMFNGAAAFNGNISSWNTGLVNNMTEMFRDAIAFNQDIGLWNVSNVGTMYRMFQGATAFNQDLLTQPGAGNGGGDAWNIGLVTNTALMFSGATNFNGDISNWDVDQITDMLGMFAYSAFNQDISSWQPLMVNDMSAMFEGATAFNQDISGWNVSSVDFMGNMFLGATAFNQPIGAWGATTSSVTSMLQMFLGATAFNQDLSTWDISLVGDMRWMFQGATAFDQSLGAWDIDGKSILGLLDGSGLSTGNYDATIIEWEALAPAANVLSASGLTYCTSASQRQNLIDTYGWTVTDANVQDCSEAYTVINTNDDGVGSLRWCIDNANAIGGINTISFSISSTDTNYNLDGGTGDETWTISPLTDLPDITETIILDATTQPGVGNFKIIIDGGPNGLTNGFHIGDTNGLDSEFYGFYLMGFTSAIFLNYATTGGGALIGAPGKANTFVNNLTGINTSNTDVNVIQSNFIGTDEYGNPGLGNATGISFNTFSSGNTIGGPNPGEGNVISGNTGRAISSNTSGGILIQGNYIGTDVTGMIAIPNTGPDVISLGTSGTSNILDNVISGNSGTALQLVATSDCIIQGNLIGVASDGSTSLGNDIGIEAVGNVDGHTIGGVGAGEGNTIANNTSIGISFGGTNVDTNSFIGNSIYCNGTGILLNATGNNNIQPPVINEVTAATIGGTGVTGEDIHVYRDNSGCTPTDPQGQEYLGTDTVVGGVWQLSGLTIAASDIITATASNLTDGTSEFSLALTIPPPGNAIDFTGGGTGDGDVVVIPDNPSFDLDFGDNDFTAEMWISTTSTGGPTLMGKHQCGFPNGWYVQLTGSNFQFYAGNRYLSSVATINDGNWHHIAVSFNATTNVQSIYVDGSLDATQTAFNGIDSNVPTGIGGWAHSACGVGNGGITAEIDEVRIWNDVRTLTEIQNHRYNELVGNEQGLAAYYTFNQGVAAGDNTSPAINIAIDMTGNGNDGTLTNMALTGATSNWVESSAFTPLTPTDLFTTEVSDTQIDLSWTDNSFSETQFLIERSDGNNTTYVQIGTASADATTYQDGSVTPGNGYFYRIRATDGTLNSTYTNEVFAGTLTPPGNALDFDGVDDYVELGNPEEYRITGDLTIEAWVNWPGNTTGNTQTIFARSYDFGETADTDIFYRFAITANGELSDFFEVNGVNQSTISTGTIPVSEWTHVAMVRNATDLTEEFYINGVFAGKSSIPAVPSDGTHPGQRVWIGNRLGASIYFDGVMDELRIWNVARTKDQIRSDFLSAVSLDGDESGLVGYFRFDQAGNFSELPDRSLNNNTGALTNFPADPSANWVSSLAMLGAGLQPTNLFTTEVSSTQIDLTWDDPMLAEDGFSIERSDGNKTNYVEIGTVGPDVLTFSNNTVSADEGYFYRVIGTSSAINSIPSREKFASTLTSPGNALEFDGIDDNLIVFNPEDLGGAPGQSFTWEAWLRVPPDISGGSGSSRFFLSRVQQGQDHPRTDMSINKTTGLIGTTIQSAGGATTQGITGLTDIRDFQWHHVAWVRDAAADEIRLYIDGALEASETDDDVDGSNNGDLYIGDWGRIPQNGRNFYENMDEVRFWNVARSQSEIRESLSKPLVGNELGLVAYYKFDQDETTDLTLPDRSINFNNGIWNGPTSGGTEPIWVASDALDETVIVNNSLDFDGTDDFVSISDDPLLQFGTGDVTIEAWFYFDGNPTIASVVAKRNPADPFSQLNILISDGIFNGLPGSKIFVEALPDGRSFVGLNPGPNDRFVASNSDLTAGWHHVALVQDYDVGLTLYLNGINQGTSTTDHGGLSFNISGLPFTIGSFNGGGFLNGQVDEVRIWNDVRTESEIQNNIQVDLAGNESNLVAYYDFNSGVSSGNNVGLTSLPDQTVNSLDGTITNFTLTGATSNWITSGAQDGLPNEPLNLFTEEISDTQINLSWTDNSFDETDFLIERSDGDNSNFVQIGTSEADASTFVDNSVSAGMGYFYRVRATNASGNSAYSNEKFGSTLTAPGNALSFDGVDDYVDFGDVDLSGYSALTVEGWIKPSYVPSGPSDETTTIIGKGATGGVGTTTFALVLEGSDMGGELFALVDNGSSLEVARFNFGNGFDIVDNEWRHVAMTWSSGNPVRLYVDGIERDATSNFSGTLNVVPESLVLGTSTDINEIGFSGEIDEILIWNLARSEAEIQSDIQTTLNGNEPGLVAYYRFDQGIPNGDNTTPAIDLLPDRSQNNNNATLTGFSLNGATSNWVTSSIPEITNGVLTSDYDALVALYNSTDGANWTDNSNWLSTNPVSTWYGVVVNSNRIDELNLNSNNLSGTLPGDIGNLIDLTTLELNDNQLTGSIPTEIGNLVNLQTLYLYNNLLSGTIPSELGNITNMVDLRIQHNQFTGSIPPELGNLSFLEDLVLHHNQLTGSIPPEVTNASNLIKFEVDFNMLSGTIPNEFGDLANLVELEFHDNLLTGSIPSNFINLTNLIELEIENNQFTDLPDLSSLSSLNLLIIGDNRFQFDDIEPNIGITGISYDPQANISAPADQDLNAGDLLDVTISVGGSNNSYQWYLDGSPVSGQTSDNLNIASVSESDQGSYHMEVTNSAVTGLTISSDPFNVTVDDNPSVITQDISVSLDATGNISITPSDIDNGSSDDETIAANLVLALDVIDFDCTTLGANTVTLTVTDEGGNSSNATATVTVTDDEMPVVVTQDVTITLDATGSASITPTDIDNGSTDNCSLTLSLDQTDFDCTNVGDQTVTLSATDGMNTSTGAAIVTVVDDEVPVVVTQDITVTLDATGTATITPTDVANGSTDNCSLTLSLDQTNFDCTEVGNQTITFTASDGTNTSTGTATVTVVDDTAPVVVTQDITVTLDATGTASITPMDIDNGSTDNCSLTLSLDQTNFDCTDVGNQTVTLTVSDGTNTSTGTATVTVVDDTAPVVVTQDITVTLDATGTASITPMDIDNGSTDNCSLTLSLDQTNFDCTDVGNQTITLTASDGTNTSTGTATVTVEDDEVPVVVTQDITITLNGSGSASITPTDVDNGSTDNCSLALSLDQTDFDCSDIGNQTVTLSASDGTNTSIGTGTVTVVDDSAPVVLTQDITITLDDTGSTSITPTDIDSGTSDNCSFDLTLDQTTFTTADLGENTVTLTATDPSGNVGNATALVTVENGNQPPSVIYIFYILENTPNGTLIGSVTGLDPDNNDLTYSIIAGNESGAFTMDAISGDLTVNDETLLDFEVTPSFDLMVEVDDGQGGMTIADVTINLIDIDEDALGVDPEVEGIRVYPNPASGKLFIDTRNRNTQELKVSLYALSGSQVEIVLDQSELFFMSIDVADLASGIYNLVIQFENKIVSRNIVIKK